MAREDHAVPGWFLGINVYPSDQHRVGAVQEDEQNQADDVGTPITQFRRFCGNNIHSEKNFNIKKIFF